MAVSMSINRVRALLTADPETAARELARYRSGELEEALAEAIRGLRDLIRDKSPRNRLSACEMLVHLKMVELRHGRAIYDGTADPVLSPLENPGTDFEGGEFDDDEEADDPKDSPPPFI